jgi:hypothetical protein
MDGRSRRMSTHAHSDETLSFPDTRPGTVSPTGAAARRPGLSVRVKAIGSVLLALATLASAASQLGWISPHTKPTIGSLDPAFTTASQMAPASRDYLGHRVTYEPANAVDGSPSTAWRVAGSGQGDWLMIEFSRTVHITSVGLIPGYAKFDPKEGVNWFMLNRTIERVRYEFSDHTSATQTFIATPTMQRMAITKNTDWIRVQVLRTSASHGRDFTAISEVQVRGF